MRILHVTHKMDPKAGGVSQAVVNIVTGLSELGIENKVISLDSASESPFESTCTQYLGPGKGPWQYSGKLKTWLKENFSSFDVVIIHGMWLHYGYAVSKLNTLLKKNKSGSFIEKHPDVFLMPHGMLDPYFQKAAGRKLKAIRNIIYWRFIEQHIVNCVDGILFTCEEESLLARKTFKNYKPKRELIVGLGVKEPPIFSEIMQDEFLKTCPRLVEKTPYILFLSRIHPKKGVDLLIKAYEKVSLRLSDKITIPKLIIAGPGLETHYGQKMRHAVSNSHAIKNSVHFTGMLEGNAKWGAFYNSRFFILPSHQENFGIAVIEAMACKKPAVITNQINIWREIDASEGGFVSKDNLADVSALLEKCILLKDEEINIIGLNAMNLFKNEFSILPAAKKMLQKISLEFKY